LVDDSKPSTPELVFKGGGHSQNQYVLIAQDLESIGPSTIYLTLETCSSIVRKIITVSCLIFSKEILLFLMLVKVPHNQVMGAKTSL
jgi:hypothetical protein